MSQLRKLLKAKIHRATVTHADLDYEGSISLPPKLMEVADIVEYEAVNIWNVTQGTRLETYAIAGAADSNDISVNGAAAHLASPGDLIIIACFSFIKEKRIERHKPKLIFVDEKNNITEITKEIPGPALRMTANSGD